MTETESEPPVLADELLVSLAEMESDPSGLGTFARYTWQAKQAVLHWVSCLKPTGPQFVVCEQVEDITLVYNGKLRFLQLKTRDKGSWSVARMCSSGLDALVRSYNAALKVGLSEISQFELWLEGAPSDVKQTTNFVEDPKLASPSIKKTLVALGLRSANLSDFLSRLKIKPYQSAQRNTDAKVCYALGALWPSLTVAELKILYERLLMAITAAQAGFVLPKTIQAYLADIQNDFPVSDDLFDEPTGAAMDAMRAQVLTLPTLRSLIPPVFGDDDALLERISKGTGVSLLELKMRRAGASSESILFAKEMRAEMDFRRQMYEASTERADLELAHLARRVITVAKAVATRTKFSAVGNPAAASRPAEAIALEFMTGSSSLKDCDTQSVFDCNGLLVYGYLAHLSDQCLFPWRAV